MIFSIKRSLLIAGIIIASLISAGCAHRVDAPTIANAAEYQQQLLTLSHWSLEGKIAVRQHNQSDSAYIRWGQNKNIFDIHISGPLGVGTVKLTGAPDKIKVSTSNGESFSRESPEKILQQQLGWSLPLNHLPQWVLGYVTHSNANFNQDNTVAGFEENNWSVEYQRYTAVNGFLLPEKIHLKQNETRITIIIKDWTLH